MKPSQHTGERARGEGGKGGGVEGGVQATAPDVGMG